MYVFFFVIAYQAIMVNHTTTLFTRLDLECYYLHALIVMIISLRIAPESRINEILYPSSPKLLTLLQKSIHQYTLLLSKLSENKLITVSCWLFE